MQFQLVDVHGEQIIVKAKFEWHLVRRPILSVSRLVDKGSAVVMGYELGNKGYMSTSPVVCIVCVRWHCRSCAHWRIKNQETMLDHHQGLWVKLLHRGHDDFHTNPLTKRECHT